MSRHTRAISRPDRPALPGRSLSALSFGGRSWYTGGVTSDERSSRWYRLVTAVLWVWLAPAVFFAMLGGMASDGCAAAGCERRITVAWLLLMACQAGLVVGAGLASSRLPDPRRLMVLAAAGSTSPAAVAVFFAYAESVT